MPQLSDEPLITGELVIRRYRPDDAEKLVESVTESIEHLRPFMPWISFEPQSVEQRRDFINDCNANWDAGGDMVVVVFAGEKLVGGSGLHRRRGGPGLEIGYWIHVDYTGRGYATAVSARLTEAAFSLPETEYVEILHDKANLASGRVPAKLGFEPIEEVAAEATSPDDSGVNCHWRITRHDFEARVAAGTWP